MNPVTVAAIIVVVALAVVGATGYAWWDYRTRPDRYGYREGERGGTRQAVHSWTSNQVNPRRLAPRPLGATRRKTFRDRT